MITGLYVFLGAAFVAVAVTPLVGRIATGLGLLDRPGVRKIHKSAIPRIGGVAIFLAMFSVIATVMALGNAAGNAFQGITGQMITLLGASAFVFLVGFVDDLRSVPARIKLLALVGASLAVCWSGARIHGIAVDGLFSVELSWASWPVTVLWIVGVTVGMNFIDGLDGLAAGISLIVCATIAVLACFTGQAAMAVTMLALMGSLVGFLFFNFNPARIFMGDCGSMLLGFVIGAGSVVCEAKTDTLVGLALPMLALGVPILDAVLTVIRRGVLNRRSIFAAERGHIHHHLLEMGFSQRRAVLLIYTATLVAAGVGMFLLVTRSAGALVIIGVVLTLQLLLFHWAGSTRIGETMAALQRNARIKHCAKVDRELFEHAQLAIHEVKSFNGWWNVVCQLAQDLGFECVSWSLADDEGARIHRIWQRQPAQFSLSDTASVTIPLRGGAVGSSRIEGTIKVADSREAMGRRIMLLGRLIDESEEDAFLRGILARRQQAVSLVTKRRRKPLKQLERVGA